MTVAESLRPCKADTPRYVPIAEHGLIGDLRTAALVGTNGTIDWYCPTRFDAPSVSAPILDAARGGGFELAPDVPARAKQFYFPDTNILITRFFADDGVAEVQDFMPVEHDSREADRHRLIRRVLCVRGSLPFTARVAPRFDYGRQTHTVSVEQGHLTVFDSPDLSLALTSSVTVEADGLDAVSSFKLVEGEAAVFALDRIGDTVRPRSCPLTEAENSFNATVRYWRRWLSQSRT